MSRGLAIVVVILLAIEVWITYQIALGFQQSANALSGSPIGKLLGIVR